MTSQFSDMTSPSNFFDVVFYLLSSIFTSPSFMSVSSLVLELWQLPFVRDWPEIWKLEIPWCEFCTIPGNWGKLGRPKIRDKITPSRLGLIIWWKVFVKWACRFSCEHFKFFSIKKLRKKLFPNKYIILRYSWFSLFYCTYFYVSIAVKVGHGWEVDLLFSSSINALKEMRHNRLNPSRPMHFK